MDARVQRRVQRYGWDLASARYDALWREQLGAAQNQLLACAGLREGERVIDVASGTGAVALAAARGVGARGRVVGVDISERMVEAARRGAEAHLLPHATFVRMDAERLDLPGNAFDVALCSLGLMYLPDPLRALREMRRVLRPGGRAVVAVWGERARCAWSAVFPIVDAEVTTEVCPLFFHLGEHQALARLCSQAGLRPLEQHRISATLHYPSDDEASEAALTAGPVAMAWSRFDAATRARVRQRYLEAIAGWRHDRGYRLPGEFVVLAAQRMNHEEMTE